MLLFKGFSASPVVFRIDHSGCQPASDRLLEGDGAFSYLIGQQAQALYNSDTTSAARGLQFSTADIFTSWG